MATVIVLLTWVSTFGLFYYMSQMKANNSMDICLFNGGQAKTCTMNFSEHLALWQKLVRALPVSGGLLVLFSLIIVFNTFYYFLSHFSLLFLEKSFFRWKLYLREHPHLSTFNFLLELFSQGILHSKIYSTLAI